MVEDVIFQYLKDKHMDNFLLSELYTKYFRFLYLQRKPVTEDDFTLFRVLGRGGFGLVNGCKKCTTGKLYAMKIMNKKRVKMKKSEELCLNERRILAMVESPFVVCVRFVFGSLTRMATHFLISNSFFASFHCSRCIDAGLLEICFHDRQRSVFDP